MNDKKLWKVFSEYIRLRDSDQNGYCKCFTCSVVRYWRQMDCGHGIPRQHLGTKYAERNNHAQCKGCNGFQGGKREVYKAEMEKRYGPNAWDLMELTSKRVCKIGQFEIDAMEKYFREQVKILRAGKNLAA